MKVETIDRGFSAVDEQIIRTLLYYDIFNYPLKPEEILRFLRVRSTHEAAFYASLNSLKERNIIFQFGNFYSLKDNKASIERRLKGNREAEKYLVIAAKQAMLISKFPFVRGVLASGSLSKGYMDENSDLDFFIITAPKRLWIARTLLVMYKRILLFNSHKHFCVNYFVDEDHLQIEEKNLFTATELATVIPLYGCQQYEDLHRANVWLKNFFPNYRRLDASQVPASKSSFGKRVMEKFLNVFFADYLERYFLRKTLDRWKKLYQKDYSAADFKIAFKSKSYAAKNHDKNFQRKIMDLYEEKLRSNGIHMNPAFAWENANDDDYSHEKTRFNLTGRA